MLLSKAESAAHRRAALSSLFVMSLVMSMAWGGDSYAFMVGHLIYRKAWRQKGL